MSSTTSITCCFKNIKLNNNLRLYLQSCFQPRNPQTPYRHLQNPHTVTKPPNKPTITQHPRPPKQTPQSKTKSTSVSSRNPPPIVDGPLNPVYQPLSYTAILARNDDYVATKISEGWNEGMVSAAKELGWSQYGLWMLQPSPSWSIESLVLNKDTDVSTTLDQYLTVNLHSYINCQIKCHKFHQN